MDGSETHDQAQGQAADDWIPRLRKLRTPSKVCLLTTLNPDRGLSLALRQHLAQEVPEIEFILSPRDAVDSPRDAVDAVWVCGYEPGQERIVRTLRSRHGAAVIVITGREPVEGWEAEVADAGADFAFSWPVAYGLLGKVLQGGLPSKRLGARRREGLSA